MNSEQNIEINNVEAFIDNSITRIEIIWEGREYVKRGRFETFIQDEWRTLKIFIKNELWKN
jgi:hypothetical protein